MKKDYSNDSVVYGLDGLAEAWEIPGGARAVKYLLLAAGFLTGAYRSKKPHLPYQRFLDQGYFRVIFRNVQGTLQAASFCVTNKGLDPVKRGLRALGVHIPEPDDFF